jgi:hypothetical protein
MNSKSGLNGFLEKGKLSGESEDINKRREG